MRVHEGREDLKSLLQPAIKKAPSKLGV